MKNQEPQDVGESQRASGDASVATPRKIALPQSYARPLRKLGLTLAALGVTYLFWRYDWVRLPQGCSPVPHIPPGARCIVDRRPPQLRSGDAVLYLVAVQGLTLGSLEATDGSGRNWRLAPAPEDCPVPTSGEPLFITPGDIRGRIVFVWAD